MKRNIFVLVFTFLLTCVASAQTVMPRGFDTPPATATETASEEAPTKQTESATEPEAPATEAQTELERILEEPTATEAALSTRIEELHARIAELEKRPQVNPARLQERLVQIQNEVRPSIPWYVWIVLGVLFIFDLGLFFGKSGKRHWHEAEPQPEPEPEPERDRAYDGFRRGGPGTATALILALFGIGGITASAHAECKITAITNGSVVVKEQAAAPITIALRGCDKEVTAIVAAASGVSFADIKSEKGKVTAKVTAKASAATGPAAVKVTFVDNSEVISSNAVYLLVLDPQTAVIRKDAAVAKTEAVAAKAVAAKTQKEVREVKAEIAKVSAAVASRPTSAEVQTLVEQAVAPYQARVADLERELAAVQTAQAENAERVALLGRATELLAEGQSALGRKRIGVFRRPFNPAVAASADKVRQAVATTVAAN